MTILSQLAIVGAVGAGVTVLLGRFKLPVVAGLLASGALIGPFGFALIHEPRIIEVLAEAGVVLLLFTIGLEFSTERLRHIFRQVAVGGAVQVLLTIAVVSLFAAAAGQPFRSALFLGFIFAMSSTAIVLRSLSERGELDAPHGRFIVGTLIFQDLCVVPMVLMIPILASPGGGGFTGLKVVMAMGNAAVIVLVVLVVARAAVPRMLHLVSASRSREVFLLSVMALCTGTMWLTSLAGLSLALGAFLSGMVIADTEFRHRALGDMIPMRDTFVSVFFISLGMMFNAWIVLERPFLVAALLLGFAVVKGILATAAASIMRFPPRAAWLAGVGLAQFGEFGFVLLTMGQSHGLVERGFVRAVLDAGVISMFLTPLLIRLAPGISAGERVLAPLSRILGVRGIDEAATEEVPDGHVVVVGFGLAGKSLTEALGNCGIPYVILELNADKVRMARLGGEPIYHADATSAEALSHAKVVQARAVVVLINDPKAAERVVDTLRREAPSVPVILRTRYILDVEKYERLGADEIVTEETEAAVEVVARVLRRLEVPGNVIVDQIREVRRRTRPSPRKVTIPRQGLSDVGALANMRIETFLVGEGAAAAHSTIAALRIRTVTGAWVAGIGRGGKLRENPDPNQPLQAGDVIYLAGSGEAIRRAMDLLSGGRLV